MNVSKGIVVLLIIALMAMVPQMAVAAAETNESVPGMVAEMDETVNVSELGVSSIRTTDILSFPRKNDTLFDECGYLIWEDSFMGSTTPKITVGLVPNGKEVIPSNAIWVEVREYASNDGTRAYYTWYPPSGKEGYYSLLVYVDHETSGMEKGTNDQDDYRSEGPFYLEDNPFSAPPPI